MKLIPVDELLIAANRQRREFDPEKMQELVDSIRERGLLQPIVRREDDGRSVLVAGERRIRALVDIWELGGTVRFDGEALPAGMLPTITTGELDQLAAEEAELEENIRRADLTWQEHAAAVARIAEIRARRADAEGKPPPTVRDIAEETYAPKREGFGAGATPHGIEETRQILAVARHLDKPEVAGAKDVREAFKILRRNEERERNVQLAASVGATFHAGLHTVVQANCLDWLRSAEPGSVDVILTDPPYGMGGQEFGDAGGKVTATHDYDDSYEAWVALMQAWCPLAYAVAKPAAHAYVFCDIDNFAALKGMMAAAGWQVHRTPIVVHKLNGVRVPWPEHGPRRCWELCLYAIKGGRRTTAIYSDVIPVRGDENLGHGAQKPVALYTDLLKRSVQPGDRVLDTFAGTGTIFPAAHELKCIATGVEEAPAAYGICLNRLKGLA